MSDAPERLTTYVDDPSVDPNIYTANLLRKVEYVRADIHEAVAKELDALKSACAAFEEWFNGVALDWIPNEVFQRNGFDRIEAIRKLIGKGGK